MFYNFTDMKFRFYFAVHNFENFDTHTNIKFEASAVFIFETRQAAERFRKVWDALYLGIPVLIIVTCGSPSKKLTMPSDVFGIRISSHRGVGER